MSTHDIHNKFVDRLYVILIVPLFSVYVCKINKLIYVSVPLTNKIPPVINSKTSILYWKLPLIYASSCRPLNINLPNHTQKNLNLLETKYFKIGHKYLIEFTILPSPTIPMQMWLKLQKHHICLNNVLQIYKPFVNFDEMKPCAAYC